MTEDEFKSEIASLPDPRMVEDYEEAVLGLAQTSTGDHRKKLLEMLAGRPASFTLTPEQRIGRALRSVLERIADGEEFLETRQLRRISIGLEYFLPSILDETYPYWKHESLDGFFFSEARKVDARQAELFGMCILISDQTLTPLHLRLKVAPSEGKIDWMECNLGERGPGAGGMERVPWSQWRYNPFAGLPNSKELMDWVFRVTVQT